MSISLSAAGIADVTLESVEKSLDGYTLQRGGLFEPVENATLEQPNILVIAEAPNNKITVLYPPCLKEGNAISLHLSRNLNAPVFDFQIHDGTLWTYFLYRLGDELGRFSTMPDYFSDKLTPEVRAQWKGDAAVICRNWPGITEEALTRYLVHWGIGSFANTKSYPDDVFEIGDSWQLLDFMSRLGLPYPLDEFGKIHGHTYQFIADSAHVPELEDPTPSPSTKKPWWNLLGK